MFSPAFPPNFPIKLPQGKSFKEQSAVSFFYGSIFLTMGIYLPFFPVWLENRGMDADQIALLLAAGMIARVLFTPIVTAWADRFPTRRLAVGFFSALAFVLMAMMMPFSSFWALLFFIFLFAIFWHTQIPLADAFALTLVRRHNASYGLMRLWGSVTFIAVNVAAGFALQKWGSSSLYFMLLATLALCVVSAAFLPRTDRKPLKAGGVTSQSTAFFRSRPFLAISLSAGFIHASHALIYGFGTIHWQNLGLSGGLIGVLWAVGVVAEIILFARSKTIFAKISPQMLMLIGGLGGVVRWVLFPFATDFVDIFMLQILHGLSFGAAHLATQSYISKNVSEADTPAAQGAMIFIGGLAMGVLTLMSGRVYAMFDGFGYWAMAGVCVVGCLCLLIGRGKKFAINV